MTSDSQETIDWSDRRSFPRSTVIWTGEAAGPTREIDSVILNVSAGGAKLRVLSEVESSPDITLRIDGAGEFEGEIVWRCGHYIGVRFTTPPEIVAGKLAQAMILRQQTQAEPSLATE